jgi:hypothetical protein
MSVGVAVGMALLAAVLFAVAAVAQNVAVADVARAGRTPTLGGAQFRSLARSRTWLGGVSLTTIASVVHAGALVLAPVALVQPIGVLSVPFAVVLAAGRTRIRPPAVVWLAAAVCLGSVAGFVALADVGLGTSPSPRFVDVVIAALVTGALVGGLALWATGRSGWLRCVGFAASGATAFGLVSALMRLIALHLRTGVNDLDDVGVWLPAIGIALALVVGGWAVQQAHASGSPAVVVGCLTVIDPLVAVVLGIAMLGEGAATTLGIAGGLVGFALLGLGAALLLARRHPEAQHPPAAPPGGSGRRGSGRLQPVPVAPEGDDGRHAGAVDAAVDGRVDEPAA